MKYLKLSEICNPKQWKTLSTEQLLDKGFPVYGANGKIGYYSTYNHELPTIMITCRGATCGSINISEPKSWINGNAMCLDNLSSDVSLKYLAFYLQNYNFNHVISGSAQPQITREGLEKVKVKVYAKELQEKISIQLDKVQKIISESKAILEKYDTLIKSRFIEMFGDPLENNKKWDSKKLENLCEIVRGGSPRPIDKFLGGAIPWIKIGDATIGDDIFLYKTKEHIIEDGIKKSRLISEGSLIFANCGVSLGFARIIKFQGCIHDGWLAFQNIDASINNIFLLKSINMCTDYFRRTAPDGTQPNLNTTIMKNFVQIIPPIKLQEEYVSFVHQIDKSKFAVQKSLEKAEILYKSLMQQYFA